MTRIDRKTGEPILSPKLTADQLYAMANEPGWRPWMRLIAEHPHAWPALIDWWHNAQRQGFDAAGAAPKLPIHAPSPPRRHTIRATAAGRRTRTGTRAGIYGICG